jgi:ATP/maltotriose-dependent transcriptional regulator MalT
VIRIEFTEDEMQDYERYTHPRVQREMEALCLKSLGMSHNEIGRRTGISANTLRTYLREYQQGGHRGVETD